MRKLVLLLLALALCGCAGPEPEPTPEPTAVVTAAPTPTPSPTPEPSPTPRPLRPAELRDGALPAALYAEGAEAGYVTELFYETFDYAAGSPEPIQKRLTVYVPYGYDPEGQYDVLFLSHIMGWDENFWFWEDFSCPSDDGQHSGIYLFTLLDNMIAGGWCKPLLVVSVDNYLYDEDGWVHNSARTYGQFGREFAEDILPAVVETFATHAAGSSREELSAAREHFGFLGASFGAYVTYNCLLPDCFDLVSHFAVTGGGSMDGAQLENQWAALGHEEYTLRCLFFGQGEYDDRQGPEGGYYNLHYYPAHFSDENLHLLLYPGIGHEEQEWILTVYNALQLFFR